METSIASTAKSPVQKFLDVPYDQRWELLKPTIVRIYMEENNKLARVAGRLKDEYSFDAEVHHYRYRFQKWRIKKRTTTEEKGAIISALGKRRRQDGASTSNAIIDQGDFKKMVDKKQLKRHINQSIRHSQKDPLILSSGLFLRHDLPYAALVRSLGGYDHPSPLSAGPATPDYVVIKSPQAVASPQETHNTISPAMQLIRRMSLLDRSRRFLEGRVQNLILEMSRDERKSAATWLHDFWMFSFMTVKYWGRGPEIWTPSLINFKSFAGQPIPSTPDHHVSPGHGSNSSPMAIDWVSNHPTQLCSWSIHYQNTVCYERIPSPPPGPHDEPGKQFDIDDESTWTAWRMDVPSRNLTSTITQALVENTFTKIQGEDIPLATDSLAEAIKMSPDESNAEAFGFAIMSRNYEALEDIMDQYDDELPKCFSSIFPFHLAAKFLDGAKTCCLIINSLANSLHGVNSIGINYVDNSGHTILDTLFIKILRSHSTVSTETLHDTFASQARYPGEEVDPCGRWDADSPCVRQLYASGRPTIPSQWKHMFCHTSIQAICHCISAMFMIPHRPNINTPSGLFVKRCGCCGLELRLGPLHSLVLTAFHLASKGMPGENLFGMVSCLVCLLTLRVDPCARAEVSIPALLGRDVGDECQHSFMNVAELASQIPLEAMESWSSEVRIGWKVLISILQHDIAKRRDTTATSGDGIITADSCEHHIHDYERGAGVGFIYCGNRQLGMVWAAIQAELLTYRRLNEGDPWISPHFDMEILLKGLEDDGDGYLIRLADGIEDVGEGRLNSYSHCGLFDANHPGCARREEICRSYYANLDDWKRTSFIVVPEWQN